MRRSSLPREDRKRRDQHARIIRAALRDPQKRIVLRATLGDSLKALSDEGMR